MKAIKLFVILLLLSPLSAYSGLEYSGNDVYVRVVDVGAGLCCIVKMPENHYIIYDCGNDPYTFDAITEVIPESCRIDLMVLSHTDADHLGAVKNICDSYGVDRIIHSGLKRESKTWSDANDAILAESEGANGCKDINLSTTEFPAGATYRFGDAFATMVCGFGEPPKEWEGLNEAETNNAGSVVIRLQYKGKSILFCGDAVGRHENAPLTQCIATEKFMIDMSPSIPIKSDVIIAPHHGGDNGSSTAFIDKVEPTYVVFSAGHRYEHPRMQTVQRYLNAGVKESHIFRTDLGDDEGSKEWDGGRVAGQHDLAGDDDIEIVIRENGDLVVDYR
jgi:beta-lactamase superfamily II metal-dependent hydrolase